MIFVAGAKRGWGMIGVLIPRVRMNPTMRITEDD
jgi:hypothetical protein